MLFRNHHPWPTALGQRAAAPRVVLAWSPPKAIIIPKNAETAITTAHFSFSYAGQNWNQPGPEEFCSHLCKVVAP